MGYDWWNIAVTQDWLQTSLSMSPLLHRGRRWAGPCSSLQDGHVQILAEGHLHLRRKLQFCPWRGREAASLQGETLQVLPTGPLHQRCQLHLLMALRNCRLGFRTKFPGFWGWEDWTTCKDQVQSTFSRIAIWYRRGGPHWLCNPSWISMLAVFETHCHTGYESTP